MISVVITVLYHDCWCDHIFIMITSSLTVSNLLPLSSLLLIQYPSVRPSLFTLEATTIQVELNTNFNATCTVNEIRPEPSEFYWMLGDTRIQGLSNSGVVNSTFDVLSLYSTVTHTAAAAVYGIPLTCILVMENGGELRRSLQIYVIDGIEGMYQSSCGMRIVCHFLLLAHGHIYKVVQDTM